MSIENASTDQPERSFMRKPLHATPPDRQGFDEVRIVTVPRWKESELSGSEWRISAKIIMMRKGHILAERDFGTVENAARFLDWVMTEVRVSGGCDLSNSSYDGLCDQEGCADQAVVTYRLKARYCRDGHKSETMSQGEYRQFCERHKHRGDCGIDDGDDNYEIVRST
jgi:hypothetical protein